MRRISFALTKRQLDRRLLDIAKAFIELPVPRKKLQPDPGSPLDHLARRIGNGCLLDPRTGCWNWWRSRTVRGYASMTIDGKPRHVTRVAWELFFGARPERHEFMCHHCDNPACANVEHLFMGSQSDNMRDCYQKGRIRPPRGGQSGESNGKAVLSDDAVREIRRLRRAGVFQKEIAARFGVSDSCVALIEHRRTWAHVED